MSVIISSSSFGFTGYSGAGPNTRTCNDGTWSPLQYQCQLQACDTLVDPSNGNIELTSGNNFGSRATYSCDTGNVHKKCYVEV